jgi:hypothetical protein
MVLDSKTIQILSHVWNRHPVLYKLAQSLSQSNHPHPKPPTTTPSTTASHPPTLLSLTLPPLQFLTATIRLYPCCGHLLKSAGGFLCRTHVHQSLGCALLPSFFTLLSTPCALIDRPLCIPQLPPPLLRVFVGLLLSLRSQSCLQVLQIARLPLPQPQLVRHKKTANLHAVLMGIVMNLLCLICAGFNHERTIRLNVRQSRRHSARGCWSPYTMALQPIVDRWNFIC